MRALLRAFLVVFAVGDLIFVASMLALFDGLLAAGAMLVAGAVVFGTLIPLALLVVSLNAVIDLPNLLAEVATRHGRTGSELAEHLRNRHGAGLRRLAIREAVPVLRSAYDVRGAAAAAVALARLNPVFLVICTLCLAVQLWALAAGLPLLGIGLTT